MSASPQELDALARVLEALLFLSPEPVSAAELAAAAEAPEDAVLAAIAALRERFHGERNGIVLRELAGGFCLASDPAAEEAAKRLFGRARSATLSQAQAETLAIVAYLQPISRPDIARIRGVSADWAISALSERELVEEAGRSELGATLYRTTGAFLKYFGLSSLEDLPDVEQWDPTPQEAGELRERLLRAGDARSGAQPQGAGEQAPLPVAGWQPLEGNAEEAGEQAGEQADGSASEPARPAGQAATAAAEQAATAGAGSGEQRQTRQGDATVLNAVNGPPEGEPPAAPAPADHIPAAAEEQDDTPAGHAGTENSRAADAEQEGPAQLAKTFVLNRWERELLAE